LSTTLLSPSVDSFPQPAIDDASAQARQVRLLFKSLQSAIHRVFVGQRDLVDFTLYSLLADGHILIEGVPGLGKTLLVRTLAEALSVPMSRIQFTPDLMPADITGTTILSEKDGGGHELRFQPGPLVASIVLADEINRATPKTQSALLEAMAERQISVAGRTIKLPEPFVVLATQNPLEQEGTYPLPEAQLDRFLVKLLVDYPTEQEYHQILERTTSAAVSDEPKERFSGADVIDARRIIREVIVSSQVRTFAIRLVMATQPNSTYAPPPVKQNVAFGAGPRAAQALLMLAKVHALISGRFSVSCQDIRDVALPVLRHRLVLNFAGLSQRLAPDDLVRAAVAAIPELSGS
jgi:MoxR-like ATPase